MTLTIIIFSVLMIGCIASLYFLGNSIEKSLNQEIDELIKPQVEKKPALVIVKNKEKK